MQSSYRYILQKYIDTNNNTENYTILKSITTIHIPVKKRLL